MRKRKLFSLLALVAALSLVAAARGGGGGGARAAWPAPGHAAEPQREGDGCSAEGGQAGATALVADPSIVAVIGTSCSSAALGVADTITSDAGYLLLSPSNTNPGLTSEEAHQPLYARPAHNDRIQGAISAEFVYNELGITSAATINDESPYADGLAAAFRPNFEALGGTVTALGEGHN